MSSGRSWGCGRGHGCGQGQGSDALSQEGRPVDSDAIKSTVETVVTEGTEATHIS